MEEYRATPVREVKIENESKRTVGFLTALSTTMGTVIGAGVLFKATSVAEAIGSANLHMFFQFPDGMIPVCAGLTGTELAAAIPETGRMIKHIERIYGNTAAFLLGWAQVVIYLPANVAALLVILGTQLVNLFGLPQLMIVSVVAVVAVSILLINPLGSKAGGAFQLVMLVCRLIPLSVIVTFGLFRQEGVDFQLLPIQAGENLSFFSVLGAGLLATMFAYDGWIHVGNISGELKKLTKDLSKAISLGIIGIMIVYLLVNAVFLRTTFIDGVAGDSSATSDVAKMIFGGFGGELVTVGILISVYGIINGYTLTGMRLPYVMAKESNLPFNKLSAKFHDKTKVPVAAGILELATAIGMMAIGGSDTLTDMLIFVIWIFYTMVLAGVILPRKKESDLFRPYRVPMYPFTPLVTVTGGTSIVSSTLITQILLASMGIVLTLAGILIYSYLKRR